MPGLGFDAQPAGPAEPAGSAALWDPLIVTIDGEPADWLGSSMRIETPVNRPASATLGIRLASGWLVNVGSEAVPVLRPIEQALYDDQLVEIRTARGPLSSDFVLFQGYLQSIARTAQRTQAAGVKLVARIQALNENPDYALHGQLMIRASDRGVWREYDDSPLIPLLVSAEPAIFNPDGRGNCERQLIWRNDEQAPDGHPTEWRMPIFAHEQSSTRQSWTYARVLMYLWSWLRRGTSATLLPWPEGVQEAGLWKLIHERGYHLVNPDTLAGGPQTDKWAQVLLARPRNLSIEGLSWLDALTYVCARAGIGWVCEPRIDNLRPDGQESDVVQRLRHFVPGGDPLDLRPDLKLCSPAYRVDNKTWEEVLADNNVAGAQLQSSYEGVTNELRVIGQPTRHEVTIELRPGWAYDATRDPQVDVDPASAAAVEAALARVDSEEWKARYDRAGSLYLQNFDVLRRWIVADAGELDTAGSTLVRPFAPWTADQYAPLDLFTLGIDAARGLEEQALRPRPMQPCVTQLAPKAPLPPLVELSYNGGASWFVAPFAMSVLRRRCGVFIEIENLGASTRDTALGVANPTGLSLAEAYIGGALRVRITGSIESDSAAESGLLSSTLSLSRRRRGKLLTRRGGDVSVQRRDDDADGTSWGNSRFKADTRLTAAERNDGPIEIGEAIQTVERGDRVRHVGSVILPGIRVGHDLVDGYETMRVGYSAGDEVVQIVAEEGASDYDVSLAARADATHAIIAAVQHDYSLGDASGRGATATTTLTLEDPTALSLLRGGRSG